MIEFWINAAIAILLSAIGIMAVRQQRLFAVIILSGAYSLVAATWFVILDAVDVAFTEAAVGAGVSTVLALGTLSMVPANEKQRPVEALPLTLAIATGLLLLLAVADMPEFGSPDTPVQQHVGPHYITQSEKEIGVPNIVTSVLSSYRGFDTFGETAVIFTAAIAVFLILTGWTRKKVAKKPKPKTSASKSDV
jgi:multicomponent Na+:H+ antiporter subunit B